MTKVTLEQIYSLPCSNSEPIILKYDNFDIEVKRNITIDEKEMYINAVVNNSFSGRDFLPIAYEQTKMIIFVKLFTNINIPDKIEDLDTLYNALRVLDIKNKLYFDGLETFGFLDKCIEEQIKFKKQQICAYIAQYSENTEIIEKTGDMIEAITKLGDKLATFIEKNGNKIGKVLTNKKIKSYTDSFQNYLNKLESYGLDKIAEKVSENKEDIVKTDTLKIVN